MNRKILGIAVTLLAIAMLASPVMAIGPQKAAEVGNNPNMVTDGTGGLAFMSNAGGNTFMWFNNQASEYYGMIYHDGDASTGEGRINNALVVDLATFYDMDVHPEKYYNIWMFYSTEPVQALGGKSMLWALGQFAMGGAGDAIVANHPNGIFAMWHFVK